LTEGIAAAACRADDVFQLTQIAEAPTHLEAIAPYCTALTTQAVAMTTRIAVELYYQHWRLFNRHLAADVIDRLRSRECQRP
jgi:hypothetical protein